MISNRKIIFSLLFIGLAGIYLFFASRTPLLLGYHQFFYTPKKYNKTLRELTNENLITDFKKILPFWLGTRYSYYGNTTIPGEGKIACGYFVTTVLEDLGKPINRSELAQMPSEQMIKELAEKTKIQRFSGVRMNQFIEGIRDEGRGLYVLGLDTHTGFILYDSTGIWFIHASGSFPFCVVKQKINEAKVVIKSRYRVLGKLA